MKKTSLLRAYALFINHNNFQKGFEILSVLVFIVMSCATSASAETVYETATIYVGGTNTSASAQYLMQYEWTNGNFVKVKGGGSYGASDVGVGDLNGDGTMDLVAGRASGANNNVMYYLGGDPSGTVKYSTTYQSVSKQLGIADFNSDGYDDVAMKSGTAILSIHLGSANGLPVGFSHYVQGSYYNNPAIAVLDYNGDGIINNIINGRNDTSIDIRTETTAFLGSFVSGNLNAIDLLPAHYVSTSRQDLIIVTDVGLNDDVLYYYNNETVGSSTFSAKGRLEATILESRREGATGDVNGDGFDEAIILTASDMRVFSFTENSGTITKTRDQLISLSSNPITVHSVDMNGDGFCDVVVGYTDGTLEGYLADKTGSLTLNATISTGQTGLTSVTGIDGIEAPPAGTLIVIQ